MGLAALAEAPEGEIEAARAELARRFSGMGGCTARAAEFARLLPAYAPSVVEEALHRLWQAGAVEMHCLADGTLAFRFRPD